MALFARRALKRMLDHLSAHVPYEARQTLAHGLNQPSTAPLGFEWETALLFKPMMMSASLGRGAGGRAQRATGSSPTAPRFNNCVEGLIFGFSRGAYTARSLSGLISKCGLLTAGAPLSVNELYDRTFTGVPHFRAGAFVITGDQPQPNSDF
jgi:type VI secretion system (T6SS) phospholipase Tle1-like effector